MTFTRHTILITTHILFDWQTYWFWQLLFPYMHPSLIYTYYKNNWKHFWPSRITIRSILKLPFSVEYTYILSHMNCDIDWYIRLHKIFVLIFLLPLLKCNQLKKTKQRINWHDSDDLRLQSKNEWTKRRIYFNDGGETYKRSDLIVNISILLLLLLQKFIQCTHFERP